MGRVITIRVLRGTLNVLLAAEETFDVPSAWGSEEAKSAATHRPLSSSFWGLPYRILNINHKEELLRGLWVGFRGQGLAERKQMLSME